MTLEERVADLERKLALVDRLPNMALVHETVWDHGFSQSTGTAKAHGIRSEVEGTPPAGTTERMAFYGTAETPDGTDHRTIVGTATNGRSNQPIVGRYQKVGVDSAGLVAEEINGAGDTVLTRVQISPFGFVATGVGNPLPAFELNAGGYSIVWEAGHAFWRRPDGSRTQIQGT